MKLVWGLVTTVVAAAATAGILLAVFALLFSALPLLLIVIVAAIMVLYALVAVAVESYDLTTGLGWLTLIIDCTWSLPNTLFGAVIGLPLYLAFGWPSSAASKGGNWISFVPRSSTGFGNNVLQTLGTVNLGGAGQHERMHLLQARIFGPLYLPLFALFYILTFLIQGLFTLILGLVLKATGARNSASLQPPANSAVPGFWGWIYYATPFEVWAYATGNP
jgi:hypothetical protein